MIKLKTLCVAGCLVVLCTVSVFGQSRKQRWVEAASSNERVHFYSARSVIRIAPGRVKAWVRAVEKKFDLDAALDFYGDDPPDYSPEATPGHVYSMVLWEYDCAGRKSRHLQAATFDSRGNVTDAVGIPSSWLEVSPESVGESLLEAVCRAAGNSRTSPR